MKGGTTGHDGLTLRRSPVEASEATLEASKAAVEASSARRFRERVDAHYDFIWRSLRRPGVVAGDVDDAAQQVFVTAARKLARIRIGCERSFLFQTAMGAWRARTRRLDPTS